MRPALVPLMKARALIADSAKWGKGMRCNRAVFETYCAAEAIEAVAEPSPARREAYRLLHQAVGLNHNVWGLLTDWNDAPERTHAEVLAAFDKAIEAAT